MFFVIADTVRRRTAVRVVVRTRTGHPRNPSSTHGSGGKLTSSRKREDCAWGLRTLILYTYPPTVYVPSYFIRTLILYTYPHTVYVPGNLSPGIKRRGLITPSKAGVGEKNEWSYTSTLPYPFMTSIETTQFLTLQSGNQQCDSRR